MNARTLFSRSAWLLVAIPCALPCAQALAQPGAFGESIDSERLQANRGGTDLVKNDMTLTGSTSHNTAQQVITGNNTITAGSFANAAGLPVVIQNSGANVLIQNATILNLQMR
jgi:cell wall assembly regulator SMI1